MKQTVITPELDQIPADFAMPRPGPRPTSSARQSSALTISSTIFFASASNIIVLSR
jgi:hypothetical protein